MAARQWIYQDGALELRGAFYEPSTTPNGRAALVVHEADGIGQNVRRRCEMLASLGYAAAAADMHGGGEVLAPERILPAMARFRNDPGLIRSRIRAALDALIGETGCPPSSIVAIGYCFGGYAVLELARSGADIAAVASFHGLLTSAAPAVPGEVSTSIFVATGALDPLVPPQDVTGFEAEMRAAGADWHVLMHGNAYHSFSNPAVDGLGDPRMRYDPTADAVSWAAAMAFLETRLDARSAAPAARQ